MERRLCQRGNCLSTGFFVNRIGHMFDSLSGRFQDVFKNLRGHGKISDSNVSDALRDVRMSLLEADVNFKVVKGKNCPE
jgi:hypothetical protein